MQQLTADHVAKERTVGVFVDLDGGFLFAHEERKVEQVLGRLAERGRVDDEFQVGQARVAADFAEAFRDLFERGWETTHERIENQRGSSLLSKWREDFSLSLSLSRDATTHPRGNLARLVLILGDILGSELLESSLSEAQTRTLRQ